MAAENLQGYFPIVAGVLITIIVLFGMYKFLGPQIKKLGDTTNKLNENVAKDVDSISSDFGG